MSLMEVLSAPGSTAGRVAQWLVGGHSIPTAEAKASSNNDPNISCDQKLNRKAKLMNVFVKKLKVFHN